MGVLKNESEAASWYSRAAEQDYADAQYNLSVSYAKGQGVSRNPVMAYMLVILAVAQGNENAKQAQSVALSKLSPAQITEAEQMASDWQVGTPLPQETDFKTWP